MTVTYPRIYSLSTVGVVMHYNQDYLLHPIRTDFTGPNAIGKSLIADLMQVIFIADKNKIEFGTDNSTKDSRKTHTIPYKTSEAYAFVNIEISKGKFIVLGVNIRSKKSQLLRSFWILDKPYSEGDRLELSELSIPKEKLVLHKDFIANGTIPQIEELTKHLRDQKNVYLRHFTRKDDKAEFYSFLYNKQILPINLAIDDNHDAFAKIIQSFSKAKTLDTEDDRSLKSFLFDNESESFKEQYEIHKENLDRLLNDYKSLEQYIKVTRLKQRRLIDLKKFESEKEENEKRLLLANFFQSKSDQAVAKRITEKHDGTLKVEKGRFDKLKPYIPKLQSLAEKADSILQNSEKDLLTLSKYKDVYNSISEDRHAIRKLSEIQLPDIHNEKQQELNIDDYDEKEIRRRIERFVPIYNRYGSIDGISTKIAEQTEAISNHEAELQRKVSRFKEIIELLSRNVEGSIFSKVFDNQETLSEGQETVLISLLSDVKWLKPSEVSNDTRYVENLDLLKKDHIKEDLINKGYWIDIGGLHHFVPKSGEQRIFASKEKLIEAIANRQGELEQSIVKLEQEIKELDRFKRGTDFNRELILLECDLDQEVKDFSALQEVSVSLGIAQNLSHKIDRINTRVKENSQTLDILSQDLTIEPQNEDLAMQIESLGEAVDIKRKRERKLGDKLIKKESEFSHLSDRLPDLRRAVIEAEQTHANAIKSHDDHRKKLLNRFPEIDIASIDDQEYLHLSISDINDDLANSNEKYGSEYRSIANSFEETESNIEIKEQLSQTTYAFSVLETVLLGPIGHTDNIADDLTDANRSRLGMADTIHETMLSIFKQTKGKYDEYRSTISSLNTFFKGKKISDKHYFNIKWSTHSQFDINWINQLQSSAKEVHKEGELAFGETVEEYVEGFFKKATGYNQKIKLIDLLNPKTYFTLETRFTDKDNVDRPSSTGESYSAIVLLGIGRLSIVQEAKRKGIRFLILEEVSNLDRINFNNFPSIAEEFGYQILTMTPRPFGSDSEQGWYLHNLLKGLDDENINYPVLNSFFKSNENKQDLKIYLETLKD